MDGPCSASVSRLLRWMKEGPAGALPITQAGRTLGCLTAATWDDTGDLTIIERLVRWHRSALAGLAGQYPITPEGARHWLTQAVLTDEHRILFWVRNVTGESVGHVGLGQFDFVERSVDICDVLVGEPAGRTVMNAAIDAVSHWASEELRLMPTTRARAVA